MTVIGDDGTYPAPRTPGKMICGCCEHRNHHLARTCERCGWAIYAACPGCGSRFPASPGRDPFRSHRRLCPARGWTRTLASIWQMSIWARVELAFGLRPCLAARYIRAEEWKHLRLLLGRLLPT